MSTDHAPHRFFAAVHRARVLGPLAASLLALAAAGAGGAGCSTIAQVGNADGGDVPLNETDADTSNEEGGAGFGGGDGATTKSPFNGSPLCHATIKTCFPDVPYPSAADAGAGAAADASPTPISMACGGDAADGGDAASPGAADGAYSSVACRVRTSGADTSAPTCSASGAGSDGAMCKTGADCSPGFDCTGAGVCRRYCCQGECSGKMNGSNNFFCDIVSLTEETTLIPACVPVKACSLLDPKACADSKETCAIVKDDGTTSCVAAGSAGQGASCDEAHCSAGLVCLGQPGVRQCFQLCKMQESTCPTGLTCKANALSHDPSVGICQ